MIWANHPITHVFLRFESSWVQNLDGSGTVEDIVCIICTHVGHIGHGMTNYPPNTIRYSIFTTTCAQKLTRWPAYNSQANEKKSGNNIKNNGRGQVT